MSKRDLSRLRIASVPYSGDRSAPSDRRRLWHYAKLRGLDLEVYRPGERYDAVFLASLSDITAWSREPRGGPKLVFDLSDSYFDVERTHLKGILRGPMKFVLGQHSHLELSYHDSLARMCGRADAVTCSTPEQAARIRAFNENVHPILDFQGGAVRRIKHDYGIGSPVNFVWEGQALNVFTFSSIRDVLRRVGARRPVALHLVTDLAFKPVNAPVPAISTRRIVDKHLAGVRTYLYEWNEAMFATLATSCDVALIPMSGGGMHRAKAENKLLIFWRMAVPTITEATPAYRRTMDAAGQDFACASSAEWEECIERVLGDEELRRSSATKGRAYAEEHEGERALAAKWDALFDRLFP